MAWSFYGCGTCFVPSRSIVRWRRGWFVPADYDGLECLCVFLMPVVPIRAVHAFDWSLATREWDWRTGERDDTDFCNTLPILWDFEMVARAYVRRWVGAVAWFAGMFMLSLVVGLSTNKLTIAECLGELCVSTLLTLATGGILGIVWLTDQRRRNICRVLGPAERLGGDPATWTAERLENYGTAQDVFGTPTFAEAVPRLLGRREFAWAMLAARMSLRCEGADGEGLTDMVLYTPEVRPALAAVRSNPSTWHRQMNNGDAKQV